MELIGKRVKFGGELLPVHYGTVHENDRSDDFSGAFKVVWDKWTGEKYCIYAPSYLLRHEIEPYVVD